MAFHGYPVISNSGTFPSPDWSVFSRSMPEMSMRSPYWWIVQALREIVREKDAELSWTEERNFEDDNIQVALSIVRNEQNYPLNFGRLVSMLEKQGTFDLDWSEVRSYIEVTCALLEPRKIVAYDHFNNLSQLQAQQVAQSMALTKNQMALQQYGNAFNVQQSQLGLGNLSNQLMGGGSGLANWFGNWFNPVK